MRRGSLQGGSLIISLVLLAIAPGGRAMDERVIQETFYPYADEMEYPEGYQPGVTITAANVDSYRQMLDDSSYDLVKNGWLEIETTPTASFDVFERYVQDTREHADAVRLATDGNLAGYTAGRPFPQQPDADDPQAGLKLMWNYQRGLFSGNSFEITPFYWVYRDARKNKEQRTLHLLFRSMVWLHRSLSEPLGAVDDAPADAFRSLYLGVTEPFDVANTQLLIVRYEDDTVRDDAWLYLGFQRRVRRLATGQTTDAFLGSDIMIEDFEGYNGRLSDYDWEYVDTQWLLVTYYNHNELSAYSSKPKNDPDGFKMVKFGGKGGCFPQVKYQLRKVYKIVGTPKDPNHPISSRVIFQDVQTAALPRTLIFDRAGKLWKWFNIGLAHPDHHLDVNKGAGIPLFDAATFLDVQAEHCTALQFKTRSPANDLRPSQFAVQYLRRSAH